VTSISGQISLFGKVKVLVTGQRVDFGGKEAGLNNDFPRAWAAKDLTVSRRCHAPLVACGS
jgi:hypothetical protein